MAISNQNGRILEKKEHGVSAEDSLSCPRMVTRLWGMIVAIGKCNEYDRI